MAEVSRLVEQSRAELQRMKLQFIQNCGAEPRASSSAAAAPAPAPAPVSSRVLPAAASAVPPPRPAAPPTVNDGFAGRPALSPPTTPTSWARKFDPQRGLGATLAAPASPQRSVSNDRPATAQRPEELRRVQAWATSQLDDDAPSGHLSAHSWNRERERQQTGARETLPSAFRHGGRSRSASQSTRNTRQEDYSEATSRLEFPMDARLGHRSGEARFSDAGGPAFPRQSAPRQEPGPEDESWVLREYMRYRRLLQEKAHVKQAWQPHSSDGASSCSECARSDSEDYCSSELSPHENWERNPTTVPRARSAPVHHCPMCQAEAAQAAHKGVAPLQRQPQLPAAPQPMFTPPVSVVQGDRHVQFAIPGHPPSSWPVEQQNPRPEVAMQQVHSSSFSGPSQPNQPLLPVQTDPAMAILAQLQQLLTAASSAPTANPAPLAAAPQGTQGHQAPPNLALLLAQMVQQLQPSVPQPQPQPEAAEGKQKSKKEKKKDKKGKGKSKRRRRSSSQSGSNSSTRSSSASEKRSPSVESTDSKRDKAEGREKRSRKEKREKEKDKAKEKEKEKERALAKERELQQEIERRLQEEREKRQREDEERERIRREEERRREAQEEERRRLQKEEDERRERERKREEEERRKREEEEEKPKKAKEKEKAKKSSDSSEDEKPQKKPAKKVKSDSEEETRSPKARDDDEEDSDAGDDCGAFIKGMPVANALWCLNGLLQSIQEYFSRGDDDEDTVFPYHAAIIRKKKKAEPRPTAWKEKQLLFNTIIQGGKITTFKPFTKGECVSDLLKYWKGGFLTGDLKRAILKGKFKRRDLSKHVDDELLDGWNLFLNHLGFLFDKEKKSKDELCGAFAAPLVHRHKDKKKASAGIASALASLGVREEYEPSCLKNPAKKAAPAKATKKAASDDEEDEAPRPSAALAGFGGGASDIFGAGGMSGLLKPRGRGGGGWGRPPAKRSLALAATSFGDDFD
eukprot:TRINITY_DN5799_c0_g2_i1.p1 TRINITY_DN5799_c0_g2~~TRINITY_DN5799_c0_g2_i1.p1  ORF type:complete len:972 (-),score=180.47 TRINITY_DN5799_c0_g2_i1:118-3033(-)